MSKFEYKPEKKSNWLEDLKIFNWLANFWLKIITFIVIMAFLAKYFSEENNWLIVFIAFVVCFWGLSTIIIAMKEDS